MKDFDKNIKNKLDDFSIEHYDLDEGWGKFQGRKKKKTIWIRVVPGIAAACIVAITGYWLLNVDSSNHNEVVGLTIPLQKKSSSQTRDTTVKRIDDRDEDGQLFSLEKIPDVLAKSKKRYAGKIQQPQSIRKDAFEPGRKDLAVGKEVGTRSLHTMVVENGSQKNKPLEIVSEEQLLAMISVAKETEPKQSKLKKFLIRKGEQQVYTVDKYSSDPDNVSLINF